MDLGNAGSPFLDYRVVAGSGEARSCACTPRCVMGMVGEKMALIGKKSPLMEASTRLGFKAGVWAGVQLVRSNHDMWTLQVQVMNDDRDVLLSEHILISPSQIDNFVGVGVPVVNPIPSQKEVRKK